MYMPHIKFQDSSIRGSRVSQLPSITDRQTDGRMERPKPICPLNFSKVGGIKIQNSIPLIWDIVLLSMELYIVASHLNLLEVILTDDTMYSLIENLTKMLQIYIKFSFLCDNWHCYLSSTSKFSDFALICP